MQDPSPEDPSPRGMQFIDFEYARWGYRGLDFGNHFNEYAGLDCDYSRYPDKHHITLFMHHYLSEGANRDPVRVACSF